MRFDVLMNPKMSHSLFANHQYIFESDISMEVFNSFIDFWNTGEFPKENINKENFIEYELLCDEVQIDKIKSLIEQKRSEIGENSINISKIRSSKIRDKSSTEKSISKCLDKYFVNYGKELLSLPIQNLFNIISNNECNFEKHDLFYNLIKQRYDETLEKSIFTLLRFIEFDKLTQENQQESIILSDSRNCHTPHININKMMNKIEEQSKSIDELKEIIELLLINQEYNSYDKILSTKDDVRDASKNIYINKLRELVLPKYDDTNGFTFLLNPHNYTSIISGSKNINKIIIPKMIEYQSKQFLIVGFEPYSNSFKSLINLTIPESISEFKKGWCIGLENLTKISVSPQNIFLKSIDDKFIVGKSNPKSKKYNIFYFALRNITDVRIPDEIKMIAPYCFNCCKKLKNVEISPNSCLIKIDDAAFARSLIKSIMIPKHVRKIGNNSFDNCENLKTIEFLPDSELYSIGYYAFDNIPLKSLTITENVSELSDAWCGYTRKLAKISVSPLNQNYKSINDQYFVGKSNKNIERYDILYFVSRDITEFIIPDEIKIIAPYCFDCCEKLNQVEISPNSNLVEICQSAFANSSIKKIIIPQNIKPLQIHKNAFLYARNFTGIQNNP